jgi:aconitate hydratase
MNQTAFSDPFQVMRELRLGDKRYRYFSLLALAEQGFPNLPKLPFAWRILLEGLLRNLGRTGFTDGHVRQLAGWQPGQGCPPIPFLPARVLLQDFTGIPVLNDLTSLRAALQKKGCNPREVDCRIPCDLVVDHSLQVDEHGCTAARKINEELEFRRNRERYQFLRWCQGAYSNLRVIPPASGIIHQVNMEYLAEVVSVRPDEKGTLWAFPDTVLGSDSHTTMVNGLGVLGWGVGGIEAVATLLKVASEISLPPVIGLKLTGCLPGGLTPTDLTLHVTSRLRREGVVGRIVEVFGSAVPHLSAEDRCMLANMTPESGATATFFPVDGRTLDYLRLTGRPEAHICLAELYCQAQGLFREDWEQSCVYERVIEMDISQLQPVLAGPSRPYDLIPVSDLKSSLVQFTKTESPKDERGQDDIVVELNGKPLSMPRAAVVLAAITSCTNTSHPFNLIGAGLLAKKAAEKELKVPVWVKTSLAPGSRVVTEYLQQSGLLPYLEQLGFYVVGYGCTTCIGNSGPLPQAIEQAVQEQGLYACAVLSGNRNFEGRIHRSVKGSFLASPLMVVACALAGRMDFDFASQPLGMDGQGKPIFLRELWPDEEEINNFVSRFIQPDLFKRNNADLLTHNSQWNELDCPSGVIFPWQQQSVYLQEPPFLQSSPEITNPAIQGARVLAYLGDAVSTDHISPAGEIEPGSPAWQYLQESGVLPEEVNAYGAYRANHQVMLRGTFANPRLHNQLAQGKYGGFTCHLPGGEIVSIFEAAMRYRAENTPLVIIAGKNYGTGSSRDWAAKGPALLGVRAVLAQSFERIHRANLVMLGILPLQFREGESAQSLGLGGREVFSIPGVEYFSMPGGEMIVTAISINGSVKQFPMRLRIDTPLEPDIFRAGGILPYILNCYHEPN